MVASKMNEGAAVAAYARANCVQGGFSEVAVGLSASVEGMTAGDQGIEAAKLSCDGLTLFFSEGVGTPLPLDQVGAFCEGVRESGLSGAEDFAAKVERAAVVASEATLG